MFQKHGLIEAFNLDIMNLVKFLSEWLKYTRLCNYVTIGADKHTVLCLRNETLIIFSIFVSRLLQCTVGMTEQAYHSENPYHNSLHAADVLQALHSVCQEPKVCVWECVCVCVCMCVGVL